MVEEKKPYILNEDELNQVREKLEESEKQNKNLKILSELPSNNGQEVHEATESGEEKYVNVSVDPKTGEKIIIGEAEKQDPIGIDNALENVGEKANVEDFEKNIKIEVEDIKKVASEDTILGNFEITDETTLELLSLINEYRDGKKKITYNILPNQIKEMIDNYCKRNGVASFSVQANTIRNNIAELLIDEFIDNISMNKYVDNFNEELENIYKTTGEEISPLIKEYNESRVEMINKACEKIEDPEKKKIVEKTLDNINDAYELKEFIKAAKKIKIKKFYFEKPQKVFKEFLYKYMNVKYSIYDLGMLLPILHRHLVANNIIKDEDESALKLLLAFCIYCNNFKPENPEQHAFMYYFTYNIALLDIYKGEQYDKFAIGFLNNIGKVLENLK